VAATSAENARDGIALVGFGDVDVTHRRLHIGVPHELLLRANAAWIERRDPAELQRILIRLLALLDAHR
jgi:hypothetical protein